MYLQMSCETNHTMNHIVHVHYRPQLMLVTTVKVTKGRILNFTKNAFSQSDLELETLSKDQNNGQKYANSLAPLPRRLVPVSLNRD